MSEPMRLSAALESPAFATYKVLPTNKTTLAVHPTESATLLFSNGCNPFSIVVFLSNSSPCSEPRIVSNYRKVSSRALAQSPLLKFSFASRTSGIFFAQSCETSMPPCPSKTANRKISLLIRWKSTASSIYFLQPVQVLIYLAFRMRQLLPCRADTFQLAFRQLAEIETHLPSMIQYFIIINYLNQQKKEIYTIASEFKIKDHLDFPFNLWIPF